MGDTGQDQSAALAPIHSTTCSSDRREPKTSATFILADRFGKQRNYDQLQKKVTAVRRGANLTEYSLHGLRYSAAGELAEAGCADQQIAVITGHKSLSMAQKYS